eukprot:COSAG01_NODE_1067_length_11878_cov_89.529077_1_plen_181_part_00
MAPPRRRASPLLSVRLCEAGLDGAALCGLPNADALREVYKIEEWGVRTRLLENVRTYRRAAEQQGAPVGTDGGAAAAAERSRRSRAAELTFKMPGSVVGAQPATIRVSTASKTPAGLLVPANMTGSTFKMPRTLEDVSAVVQALLHRTPTTSPRWPVRCLCLRRTVGNLEPAEHARLVAG